MSKTGVARCCETETSVVTTSDISYPLDHSWRDRDVVFGIDLSALSGEC